ncbi:phytoene desaturase family protein [Halovulum sp. GXIMD14793]
MDPTVDAIIIGSGVNSLACAMVLQRKGWRVSIYEQASEIGGAVKTGAYTAQGFKHDWAAMNLSLFAGSPFFKEFGDELTSAGLSFVPATKCFASAFKDGHWLGITTDADENHRNISAFATNDGDAWAEISADFPRQAEHIFAVLGGPFKFRPMVRTLWRIYRQQGLAGVLDLARFMSSAPRAWLDEQFDHPQIKATLAAWGMHLDFAPDIAGGAIFPYLEAMANQSFGMVIGEGGADTVTKAMAKCITDAGGTITSDTRVECVLIEEGQAKGVTLANGDTVRAQRAVIANVAPRGLAALIGEEKPDYRAKLNKFRHAPGTMMIHLAMEDLPNWQADEALRDFAYVHLAEDMDQMARTYAQAQAGLLPDAPVIVVGQPTAIDPSRAPEGKHILWLQVRMVPGTIKGDASGLINTCDWQSAADPMAERALDILESYAPGTRDKIIERKIVTPDMLEADNPNLVGGDQICGSHHLSQHFLFRPLRGHSDGTTPIKNLFHTGAAVWPGAGTGVGAGYLLGQKIT